MFASKPIERVLPAMVNYCFHHRSYKKQFAAHASVVVQARPDLYLLWIGLTDPACAGLVG